MKTGKKTIIIMIFMCVVTLCVSICLEFINICAEIELKYHIEYFENISLGVFASGLLVLIPTIVQFNIEKNNYYIEMFRYSDNILYVSLDIISAMEEYDQNAEISKNFDSFGLAYNQIVSRYSTFEFFFKLSKKDKLIESILNEITKFIMIQEELLKLSKKLKNFEIANDDYEDSFNIVREEMITVYKKNFKIYRNDLAKCMKAVLVNKTLKTYY